MASLSNISEESKILREIQATHSHDARVVDTTPIVKVVEEVLRRANLSGNDDSEGTKELVADALQEKLGTIPVGPKGTVLEALAVDIQKIGCEFSCNCNGGDLHKSTIEVLGMLGNYSWDAKVIITMAAFAVSYGELWLVTLLGFANHPLAKSIAVLRQTPELTEINGVLKSQFATLNDLLNVVLNVSKTLIEFSSLPAKYITFEDAPLATSLNQITWATYWSIRSVIACGAQITSNIGITSGLVSSTAETWDLSSLTHKMSSLFEQLRGKLVLCNTHIEVKKIEEAYGNLVSVYKTSQKDNLKLLTTLIKPRKDAKSLVKITPRNPSYVEVVAARVVGDQVEYFNVEVLKGKTVLLFISDLDVLEEEEVAILDKIYKESRMRRREKELEYEIVWLPVVDEMSADMENKLNELKHKMSWYTLNHPCFLDVASKRFIRENLGFMKKQIIVTLDPQGREASQNAYQMMLIWGNAAYPFTNLKVENLFEDLKWTPEFLIASVFPEFKIKAETYVCLFGGEDIEWIRKFAACMKEHAVRTRTAIEVVYIGKPNAREAVKRIIKIIYSEKIARTLPDVASVSYFWTRLESLLYTRMQYSSSRPGSDVDNDAIIKQIMSVLSFGSGHQGWACIGKPGFDNMVQAKGDQIVASMASPEFEERSKGNGFLGGVRDIIANIQGDCGIHCNRVEFPAIVGAAVPTKVICSTCNRLMEKYFLYKCCRG